VSGGYVGRFAPSPTGPLHAGSVVAALASWLDARAQGGRWLVRIEDVDKPRTVPGAADSMLRQLLALGLEPDARPVWQSQREDLYRAALDRLVAQQDAYPCACSRRDIALALAARGRRTGRHRELVYPGTCRSGLNGRPARAWRLRLRAVAASVGWLDRRLGPQQQDVASDVGDFVLLRADGLWAYQLAVVVDDAEQGVTHVVRGQDLADNTPRQILLQQALGAPLPAYLHVPLVLGADGHKLSKQNGASGIDIRDPLAVLNAAARHLALSPQTGPLSAALDRWVREWRALYNLPA
jgi:glutamyl-Q tRNA(Asp) synthetase